MSSSFAHHLLPILLLFFLPKPSLSSPNITFIGEAFLNTTSIILTKAKNCTSPSSSSSLQPFLPLSATLSTVGRAFYSKPIRFLNPSSNTTTSFSCTFSFSINAFDSCPLGHGFAFLITSNMTSFSLSTGYMGLPAHKDMKSSSNRESYFAVEFDTSFDPNLDDINNNHIGIDVNNVQSVASVDVSLRGIDLKSGRELTAWIEYRDPEKTITVWIEYTRNQNQNQMKPLRADLVKGIDLTTMLKEFMYVGFTASNGPGSSIHIIQRWRFKTFFGLLPNAMSMEIVERGDCAMCSSPDDSDIGFEVLTSESGKGRIPNWALLLGCFSFLLILIAALATIVCLCLSRRKMVRRARSERQLRSLKGGGMAPKMLSLSEIKSATNGFNQDKIIGEGASAVVYEGAIPSCGPVAVKRFNHESKYNASISRIPFNTEFATMVGCLRHKNLVQLQGWCCERNELVLVYEYLANGSLDKFLHNRTNISRFLTWELRLNIIHGVASALIYLHEECESQIIHRDVKTCNILLDSKFNAKLGDFGLAEVYRHSLRTRHATVPAGTMGYLAPEYAFAGIPTVKTDVYSFGVVVLEVASGRRPVEEERMIITDYVWEVWEKGMITEAADPNLMGKFNRMEMERTLMVGLSCVHPNCEKRPTMREAARMLTGESPLQVLPSRKPTVRIQSAVREEMTMGFHGEDETPWSTPATHFSRA